MKKIKKTIISVILTAILLSLGALNVFADTVYVYNGYSFTMLDNQYISICGWNNSSENFVVPAQLDGSYVKEIADLGLRDNEAITSVDSSINLCQASSFSLILGNPSNKTILFETSS